jgi:hypothetical protein
MTYKQFYIPNYYLRFYAQIHSTNRFNNIYINFNILLPV